MTGTLGLLVAASWIALAPVQTNTPSNGREIGPRSLNRTAIAAAVAANNRREASPAADPVSDGIVRGALIGAGAGVGLVALAYATCGDGCEAPAASPLFVLGGSMGAGIGAAIGWLVDGLHKDRPAAAARAVSVAPVLARRYKAVALRLRF